MVLNRRTFIKAIIALPFLGISKASNGATIELGLVPIDPSKPMFIDSTPAYVFGKQTTEIW